MFGTIAQRLHEYMQKQLMPNLDLNPIEKMWSKMKAILVVSFRENIYF